VKKVLVLGGGIGGVAAAIAFRKYGFEVELVAERDYLFVYPIAIWIPVGSAEFKDVAIPLSKLSRILSFSLTLDRVQTLDGRSKTVTLEKGGVRRDSDIVVVALGASRMKHEGGEHTVSICGNPEESLVLKEKIKQLVARGSGHIAFGFGGNPKDSSAVRGGPAFELFFNVHHYLTKLGIRERYEMTFFAPMARPGARMGEKAVSNMEKMFRANNFKTLYGNKIRRFEADGIVFENNFRIQSDLTMFIPAGDGHEIVKASDLAKNDAGFIRIDDFCRIEGVGGWYAIGDVAALDGPEWKAKQGHLAEQMAANAAFNSAVEHLGRQGALKGYQHHLHILCVMDMGDGAGFVYRDASREFFIPMPLFGHWLKKSWGYYYKLSKTGGVLHFFSR
jgi:sulfide:quinone oxidoreductase